MPVEKESKFGVAFDAARAWLATMRVRAVEWGEACREEPALIWHTPAVRYVTYGLGAILATFMLSFVVELFAPGGQPIEQAREADFRVVCSNPACGKDFIIHRKFNFDDFPVTCRYCKQHTGQRGMQCHSKQCRGRWTAPQVVDGIYRCPRCNAATGKED